jgi:hypothetical protein
MYAVDGPPKSDLAEKWKNSVNICSAGFFLLKLH